MILLALLFLLSSCAGGTSSSGSLTPFGDKATKSAIFCDISTDNTIEDKSATAIEDTIVLSPMNEGETVRTAFMVKNRSGQTLHIERIFSGCGCTSAVWDRNPLEDEHETQVTLLFNSSGQFGKQFKTIEVWAEEGNMCRIFLAAEVRY